MQMCYTGTVSVPKETAVAFEVSAGMKRKSRGTTEKKTGASKEGRKPRRKDNIDDDGTQIEQVAPKKGGKRKPAVDKRGGKTEDNFLTALKAFCVATNETGVPALCREFAEMRQKDMTNIPPKTAFEANADKNRYKDVYCLDENRVTLTWPPGSASDYIHANYVPIKGEKRFICTQGPTAHTVDDFWRMVWQEKVKAIVMLCGVIEQGKPKCEQYWPLAAGEKSTTPSGVTIVNAEVNETEKHLTVTKLELAVEGSEGFTVVHFLWNGWPDRGVPDNYMACLRLLTKLKPFSPCIVHCSAGIGRTGTIVGLEAANLCLGAGEKPVFADIVRDLRVSRHGSVQTDVQFIYMHRVLIGFAENKKAVKHEDMQQFFTDFDTLLKARGAG